MSLSRALFSVWSIMWRKERQNGPGLFSEMPGGAREGCGDAGATFDLKQHFWEKGLESTLCCTQAAWARSRELLIAWPLPVPSTSPLCGCT